ncbi:MAG: inositol monophosphatase [Granulosicoccus sp.]
MARILCTDRVCLMGDVVELDVKKLLLVAQNAASEAEEVINRHLTSGQWTVTVKADDTPVTEVDIAAEQAIRGILSKALPGAGFYGEETERSESANNCHWLVDPIDGTKSFVRGMPYYSTQIALLVDEELVLGVSNAPAFAERLVGLRGDGAWLNDMPVQTRAQITDVKDAFLSTGNIASLALDRIGWQRFGLLVSMVKRTRGYGDFCHYHQLCRGQTDLIVESDVNILDIAALNVAVHAAGGVMTDLQGRPVGLETTSVVAAASSHLHQQALELLNGQ